MFSPFLGSLQVLWLPSRVPHEWVRFTDDSKLVVGMNAIVSSWFTSVLFQPCDRPDVQDVTHFSPYGSWDGL